MNDSKGGGFDVICRRCGRGNPMIKAEPNINGVMLIKGKCLNPECNTLWTSIKQNKDAFNGESVFYFGKHKDKSIKEVYREDVGYLMWVLKNPSFEGKPIRDKVELFMEAQ